MSGVQVGILEAFLGYSTKDPSKLPGGICQTLRNISVRNGNLVKATGMVLAELNGAAVQLNGINRIDEFIKFSYNDTYICRDGMVNPSTLNVWDGVSAWNSIGNIGNISGCGFIDRGKELVAACGASTPYLYGSVPEHFSYAYKCDGTPDYDPLAAQLAFYPAYLEHSHVVENLVNFHSASFTSGIPYLDLSRMYYIVLQANDGSYWLSKQGVIQATDTYVNKNAMSVVIDPSVYPGVSRVLIFSSTEADEYNTFYLIKNFAVNHRSATEAVPLLYGYPTVYDNILGTLTVPIATISDPNVIDDLYNGFVIRIINTTTGAVLNAHVVNDMAIVSSDLVIDIGAGYGYIGNLYIQIVEAWRADSGEYILRFMDALPDLTILETMQNYIGYSFSYYGSDYAINPNDVTDLYTDYTYAVIGAARMYVAGVTRNGKTYAQRVHFSYIDNNGVSRYDTFLDLDYIDVSGYNVGNIQGLDFNQQKLYAFCEKGILILSIATGDVMSWRLDRLVHEIGVIAPKSITRIPDGKFAGGYGYVAADGFRILYGGYSYNISEAINPVIATTLSEAVGYYDTDDHAWCVAFLSDERVYSYSLDTNQWSVRDGLYITNAGRGDEDQTLVCDSEYIWQFGATQFYNRESVVPYFKSNLVRFSDFAKIRRVAVRYRSDTWFYVDVYRDGVLSTSITIPASAAWNTALQKLAVSAWVNAIEFVIRLDDAVAATNTLLEVDYVEYEYQLRRAYA